MCNSYRGITVSSNLAKLLEIILLQRVCPLLEEKGLPFPQQTAYKQGVGCDDAIFTTMEVMKYYKRNGDRLYLCAYNLKKAFDFVEYSILLHHAFHAGINGKFLCSWYTDPICAVKICNTLSEPFTL